jgi:hypothetical protein
MKSYPQLIIHYTIDINAFFNQNQAALASVHRLVHICRPGDNTGGKTSNPVIHHHYYIIPFLIFFI